MHYPAGQPRSMAHVKAAAKTLRESLQGWTPTDVVVYQLDSAELQLCVSQPAERSVGKARSAGLSEQQRLRCKLRREQQRRWAEKELNVRLSAVLRLQRAYRAVRARRLFEERVARTNAATRAAAVQATLKLIDTRLWRQVDLRVHLLLRGAGTLEDCAILVLQKAWRAQKDRLAGAALLQQLKLDGAAARAAAVLQERTWHTHIGDRNEAEQQALRAWRRRRWSTAVPAHSTEARVANILAAQQSQ